MIDLKNENLLALGQAATRLPPNRSGRPVTISCVLRWVLVGVKLRDGSVVRLEAVRIGRRWLTSCEALERFGQAQTPNLDAEHQKPVRTPTRRLKAAQRADAALAKLGF